MKLCIPATEDQGPESPVSAHFGSAKHFVIVDTESGACRRVHRHGRGHDMECH
jgi:predicted Fe-Mo cluster-binding NifX family protein